MSDEIARLELELLKLGEKLAAARRRLPRETVGDYAFTTSDGDAVTLAGLFGDKRDLLAIHNMGRSCPYCTLWADGLNGVRQHIENRAALAVFSPDAPAVQKEFAGQRGWGFRMVSYDENDFAKKLGFNSSPGKYQPGVSALLKQDEGTIVRVGKASFGPGDDFCAVWHLFDLLADGVNAWEPRYNYERA